MSESLHAARRHCQKMAAGHYENFPVASLVLPSRVRPAVAAIYAFARTADDFADEPEHEGVRLERLAAWRQLLDEALAGRASEPVFIALAAAVEEFRLPPEELHALIDAFEQDCTTPRYPTFFRVLDYCTRSANPIGRLVLALHDIRDRESVAASDAICTALQLTNFWQDVAIDLDKDRIYLPHEDLVRFGVDEPMLFARRATPEIRRLLAYEAARTRTIFARGHSLVASRHGRLGLWLRLAWSGGHEILRKLERGGFDPFLRRPKLGRADWVRLAVPALLGRATPRPDAEPAPAA